MSKLGDDWLFSIFDRVEIADAGLGADRSQGQVVVLPQALQRLADIGAFRRFICHRRLDPRSSSASGTIPPDIIDTRDCHSRRCRTDHRAYGPLVDPNARGQA